MDDLRKQAIYGRVFSMDAEDKKKFDEILQLSRENNAYIKKVRKSQKASTIFTVIYWIVIVIVALGGFYFAQPYVSNMVNLYNGGISALQTVHNIQNSANKK